MSGRIAERRVDLGSLVGREGQESELFTIVDSRVVWAELALSVTDLAMVREGLQISIESANSDPLPATIMFVSPLLDKETRLARVVPVDNPSLTLRRNVRDRAHSIQPIRLRSLYPRPPFRVSRERRLHQDAEGFMPAGSSRDAKMENPSRVTSGLSPGEAIATMFVLKADLGGTKPLCPH
jgi:cobalt-zinc-cadmium efflux system membrane fusion protein